MENALITVTAIAFGTMSSMINVLIQNLFMFSKLKKMDFIHRIAAEVKFKI